jgi:XTP/dITP diphosphohydrolase
MRRKLVFATNNANKVKELAAKIGNCAELLGLGDIGCTDELPETQATLEGNARQKARYVFDKFGVSCFADDTGLEVDALNGAPGVYSARYAGPACRAEDNMVKLLNELKGKSNRKARFRTVICLVRAGEEHYFEGMAEGEITMEKSGAEGFGYDPIFRPVGHSRTFAEMTLEEKNVISHRAKAVEKLAAFLQSLA